MEGCSCFWETSFDVRRKKDLKIYIQSLSHRYAHSLLANLSRLQFTNLCTKVCTFMRIWPILRAPLVPPANSFLKTRGAEHPRALHQGNPAAQFYSTRSTCVVCCCFVTNCHSGLSKNGYLDQLNIRCWT